MFLYLSTSGWKNAQLAQQLEERETRIKGHLDMAAKGEGLLSIALFQNLVNFLCCLLPALLLKIQKNI